jgi:hypothetical protein
VKQLIKKVNYLDSDQNKFARRSKMKPTKTLVLAFTGLVLSMSQYAVADDAIHVTPAGDVGFGTNTPSAQAHVQGDSASFLRLLQLENLGGDFAGFRFTTTGGSIDFNKAGGNSFRLNVVDGDTWELQLNPDGDLTISGSIFTAGSCSAGCDRVFSTDYALPSIEEHSDAMWRDSYLPTVGPTIEGQPINLSDKTERMLNELEKAHIYIDQLHQRLKALESQQAEMQAVMMKVLENQQGQRVLTSAAMN